MSHRLSAALAGSLLATGMLGAAEIAVWDPAVDAKEGRFTILKDDRAAVVSWLKDAGLPVVKVSASTMTEGKGLDPKTYPVLVMSSHLVPITSDKAKRGPQTKAFISYMDAGGVILGLADLQGRAVFGMGIEPKGPTGWKLSPEEPRFAWDVRDIGAALGLRFVYNPAIDNLNVVHQPTALLKQYWSAAPEIKTKLPQAHHVGFAVGNDTPGFYALYDSLRVDRQPTIPAVFVARTGKRTAIITNNPGWWTPAKNPWFSGQKELTVALTRLAWDLGAGKVTLPDNLRREFSEEPAGVEPLRNRAPDSQVDPEGAQPLARWGRFDGASWELGEPAEADAVIDLTTDKAKLLPRRLDPGAHVRLPVPALQGSSWLRVRLAHTATDAGLKAHFGDQLLLNELFVYVGMTGESNFGGSQLANQASEVNRIVFMPPGPAGVLELSNPGRQPVWFDAIQVEQRPNGGSPVLFGWYASAIATQPGAVGKFAVPPAAETYGALRVDARLQHLGAPGEANRWEKLDQLYDQYASYKAPIHMIIFGTPQWMAVPASFEEAKGRKRQHICVPEREKFKQAISDWLDRYGSRFAAFELMNEVDIKQFWIGTFEEYTTLCNDIIPIIRAKAPGKLIISAGSAAQAEELMGLIRSTRMAKNIDWVANHCYSGQAPAWDLPQGLFEGHCFAMGISNPIFANEQGFVWTNSEWFQGPPAWTPERQGAATDIALARITAAGHPRVLVFTAGGDTHPYSYADELGKPRPGYAVVMDYNRLNGPGAVRSDSVLVSPEGDPVRGVYHIGSQWQDGTIRLVLNPCQASLRAPQVRLLVPLPDARPRTVTAEFSGKTSLVPSKREARDGAQWEVIELEVPARGVITLTAAGR